MKTLEFRALRADEIDVRIGQISKSGKGLSLLLYKDARCDMNVLDETVGAYNWQRLHSRDNANCSVSIWDDEKSQWISKEDTGTESKTEPEKGLASDSFKRACTNWGIGRELYTSPFIWLKNGIVDIYTDGRGKYACDDKFICTALDVKDKVIVGLAIDVRKAKTYEVIKNAYTYGTCSAPAPKIPQQKPAPKQTDTPAPPPVSAEDELKALTFLIDQTGQDIVKMLEYYNAASLNEMGAEQRKHALSTLQKKLAKQMDI